PQTLVAIEPIDGYLAGWSPPLAPPRAVSIRCPAAKWSPLSWCSERTIENLSATLACSGHNSLTSKPGTLVLIGFQMPRYSAGASGFISYRSRWLGPPSSQIRMDEVSFLACPIAADISRALSTCGSDAAAMPA